MVAGVQTPDEAALAPVVASSYRMVLVKQEREKLVLNKEIDQLRAEAAALKARVAALEKENAALRPTPAAAAPAPKTPAKSTSKLGSQAWTADVVFHRLDNKTKQGAGKQNKA